MPNFTSLGLPHDLRIAEIRSELPRIAHELPPELPKSGSATQPHVVCLPSAGCNPKGLMHAITPRTSLLRPSRFDVLPPDYTYSKGCGPQLRQVGRPLVENPKQLGPSWITPHTRLHVGRQYRGQLDQAYRTHQERPPTFNTWDDHTLHIPHPRCHRRKSLPNADCSQ